MGARGGARSVPGRCARARRRARRSGEGAQRGVGSRRHREAIGREVFRPVGRPVQDLPSGALHQYHAASAAPPAAIAHVQSARDEPPVGARVSDGDNRPHALRQVAVYLEQAGAVDIGPGREREDGKHHPRDGDRRQDDTGAERLAHHDSRRRGPCRKR